MTFALDGSQVSGGDAVKGKGFTEQHSVLSKLSNWES